jgi:hypothetical protein
MTDVDILSNLPHGLPFPECSITLLARESVVTPLPEDYRARPGDRVVLYVNNYGSTFLMDVPTSSFSQEFVTAEQWLIEQNYNPLRLVALLDLESRLRASMSTSPKLSAVREWVNSLLSAFSADASPRNDWPPPPFSFEECVADAMQLIVNQPS